MMVSSVNASEALNDQLRALCLKEYPFGSGSWQMSPKLPLATRMYSNTTTEYGSEKDHVETLNQLITNFKSPWYSESEWSEELPSLKKLAITDPHKLTPDFLQKTFRTLRLIDKNVTNIDEKLLDLKNLEELSLSANYISIIKSEFLPPKLKVLELNANLISDIESLIKNPPPLQHLGLAKNSLENLSSHISITYWPNLMSLDLGDNSLTDLLLLVENLKTLPKLRTLLLCGNPVSLMPSYRGYTVDSLGSLTSLDDVIITADERHDFKGLNKRGTELLKNEARLTIKLPFVRGLPNPAAEVDEAGASEFPVIERKYYLKFPFISNVEKRLLKSSEMLNEGQEKENAAKKAPKGKAKSPVQKSIEELEQERLDKEKAAEAERVRIAGPPNIVSFSTCKLDYDLDQLSFEHEEQFRVVALLQLKHLFTEGLKMQLIEEKTLYYPAGQTPEELAVERATSGKGHLFQSQRRRSSRLLTVGQLNQLGRRRSSQMSATDRGSTPLKPGQLGAKMAATAGGAAAKKASTHSGGQGSDLTKYSCTESCVGSAVLHLKSLLTSCEQTKVKAALHLGGGPMRPEDLEILDTPPATAASDMKKDKKDKKKATKPSGGKDKKKGLGMGEEEAEVLPPPIVLLAEVDLRRWTKTKQFVKEHDQWF
ncbi:leucine-rich repeat-containing protein 43-like isoform X2 [Symsagittifera roscoffensis]|uniref:leucine-rich repeat-containing protein 43-like isoform X2 n=1 Tax=Symsagittifera roscoffensis TaxID=84072 RepID=UPI00307CC060